MAEFAIPEALYERSIRVVRARFLTAPEPYPALYLEAELKPPTYLLLISVPGTGANPPSDLLYRVSKILVAVTFLTDR